VVAAVKLLTAGDVAALLNVSRDWVYDHQHELGAVKLGAPPTGEHDRRPLRFHEERVLAYVEQGAAPPETTAEIPQLDRTTGRDGRTSPARRGRRTRVPLGS
jgi:hypothetical protein